MSRGKEIAQSCHASLKATLENMDDPRVKEWLNGIFKKIALVVDSEGEMLSIYNKAKENGMVCSLIEDSGLTYFHGVKTKTCIAVGPDTEENVDDLCKHLKLR